MSETDLHLDELESTFESGHWTHRQGHKFEDGFRAGWIAAMRFAGNRIEAAEVSCKVLRKQRDYFKKRGK